MCVDILALVIQYANCVFPLLHDIICGLSDSTMLFYINS